jgi:hypothetical protein
MQNDLRDEILNEEIMRKEREDIRLQKRQRRYDIGLPVSDCVSGIGKPEAMITVKLALREYNQIVHDAWVLHLENKPLPDVCIPDAIVDLWVFGTNITENYSKDILLNRCQLLGLIIARYRAVYQKEYRLSQKSIPDYLTGGDNSSILYLFNKPVSAYTLKELRFVSDFMFFLIS